MPFVAAATTPTGRRCQLGALLRHLRERISLTQEEVGARVWPGRGSRSAQNKITLLENGEGGIGAADLEKLLAVLRVDDRDTVLLARRLSGGTSQRGRWRGHRAIHPGTARQFLDLEQDADLIRMVGVEQVPVLFQCESYSRAGFAPATPEDTVTASLAANRDRWRLLARTQIFAVLSESCVRRVRGDRQVMREQIRHLIDLSARHNIVLQVVPFVLPPGLRANCGLEQFALFRVPCPGATGESQRHLDFAFARTDSRPVREDTLQTYERIWLEATNSGLSPERSRRFLLSVETSYAS